MAHIIDHHEYWGVEVFDLDGKSVGKFRDCGVFIESGALTVFKHAAQVPEAYAYTAERVAAFSSVR
jgi:hypothetical protein